MADVKKACVAGLVDYARNLNHTYMNTTQIAQVAHELNKAYCASIGDNSQPSWEDAPEWQKSSAINGVQFHIDNPDATPENSHESWLKQKTEEGWKYGPVKNPETKEHPCFVPYAQLPAEQKAKDYIFRQCIHSLKHLVPSRTVLTRGQQVMSVAFNPGQREDVTAIKQIFADAFDEIDKHMTAKRKAFAANRSADAPQLGEATPEELVMHDAHRLAAIAKTNLETAQMYAVKAVTR